MPQIKIDTSEFDELLLDVLFQSCSNDEKKIDNQCLSAYENACDYLAGKGYLYTKNGRIYQLRLMAEENASK